MITPNQIAELKGLATSNGRTERIRRLAEWYESGPSYPREFEQGRQQIAADLRALLAEIEALRVGLDGWRTGIEQCLTNMEAHAKEIGLSKDEIAGREYAWAYALASFDDALPPPPKGQSNHDEA